MERRSIQTWLWAVLAAMFLMHAAVFWSLRDQVRDGYSDFSIFYTAGTILRRKAGGHLYDSGLQFRVQQEFAPHVAIRQGALPFNHPPFEALWFAPLANLPYPRAFAAWALLNLAILGALPFLLRRHVALLQRTPVVFWWLAELAFFAVFIALLQGQDSVVLLLLFSLAYVALKEKREFAAGCWLGLGLFRFHLVLPLLLILLLHKKRNVIAGFLVTALSLVLISIAILGWQEAASYPSYVWNVENSSGSAASLVSAMPNLRGFLHMIVPWTPRVAVVVSGLSALLLLWASSKWSDSGEGFDLSFSLALVTTIVVSYHVLAHDLCLLLLPLVLLGNHFSRRNWPRGFARAALLGPAIVLLCSPVQMLLWFRYGRFSILAPILLLGAVGIAQELSRTAIGNHREPA